MISLLQWTVTWNCKPNKLLIPLKFLLSGYFIKAIGKCKTPQWTQISTTAVWPARSSTTTPKLEGDKGRSLFSVKLYLWENVPMFDTFQRHGDGQMVSHWEPLRCVAVNFFLLDQTHYFSVTIPWWQHFPESHLYMVPFFLPDSLITAYFGVCIH